jgi:transcriptional regulator with XRE-family HTH domain
MAQAPSSLQETLRRARRGRRISQLELSLELGVSQRHVSFVESGRSRPSRELLIGWLQVLEAPLALSNEALLAAGYAPAYSDRHLGDPWLAEAEHALHPQGLSGHVSNLDDVGPRFLAMLRREVAAYPSLLPRVAAYEADLLARLGTTGGPANLPGAQAPVLTTHFRSPHGELAFFSMFTTFGTPNDITLASLRVEHMFPADEATRAVLQRMASSQRSA